MELRRLVQSLETLNQILQASGHTLLVGWETIFEVLVSVCRPPLLNVDSAGGQGGVDVDILILYYGPTAGGTRNS